jgi:hypothetical protein
MPSLENAMILTPTAGLSPSSPSLGSADLFEQTALYSVRYGSAAVRFGLDPILVTIDILGREPTDKDFMARTGTLDPASAKDDVIDGNNVKTVKRGTISTVTWASGQSIISMAFEQRGGLPQAERSVQAAAAGWQDLIRAYLRKYPSR